MEAIITRSVEKLALIPFTHVYPLTFKSDGVWAYGANTFPMLFTQWNSHWLKYIVAHVNGHCKGTCVYTKLWSFSHAQIFLRRISFITVEHGMDHIVEGCVTCLRTHDIFQMIWSPMMMMKMNILKVMMGSSNLMGSSTWSNHVFNTHMKSNMAQRLLLFSSNKHKKYEM